MKTLSEVRDRCYIDEDGCWIWRGGVGMGRPRIYAPDYTMNAGCMSTQIGRRAVHHILTGKPIPEGVQIFGRCRKPMCLNPDCAGQGTKAQQGRLVRKEGWLKGDVQRRIKNRQTARQRSVLTPELIAEIQASKETGVALSARLQIGRGVISKARRGELVCFQPVGGIFSGLMT